MKKMEYDSPEFEFQEMKLLERVADRCWGYGYAFYDVDGDNVPDANERIDVGASNCSGNPDSILARKNAFKLAFGIDASDDQVAPNVTGTGMLPPSGS